MQGNGVTRGEREKQEKKRVNDQGAVCKGLAARWAEEINRVPRAFKKQMASHID